MAMSYYGGTTPPTASFYGQPAVGYVGTAMPPTGCSTMPYAAAGGGYPGGYLPTAGSFAGGYPPTAGVFPGGVDPYVGGGGYPTAGMAQYAAGMQGMMPQSCMGAAYASPGGYPAVNSFNLPPAMQSFNSAGYYGYGAAAVEPYPVNAYMGVRDPYASAYADRSDYMAEQDFERDPLSSFSGHYSRYNDGHGHHGGGLGSRRGIPDRDHSYDNHAYYNPRSGRYVQRRQKGSCC